MDPARWERIEGICAAALDRAGPARHAYLDEACAGDAALRREVEALLHQAEEGPGFLDRPLVDAAAVPAPDTVPPDAPERIGPYRIVRRIGRGGMGEVFLATRERDGVEQRVALKLIRRGMDSDEVIERFRQERRILASLQHPHIARFLDADATGDGRPYVVMEYVEGVPLDEYCTRHALDLRRRLELVRVIGGAVQHAHQNLVVHRDLKPRNILVTDAGEPRLLDFGIGKVLAATEALSPGEATRTSVRLLTPEYAAPEQVTGGRITTATDVYGLGVLLYVLLTGRHPYLEGGESARDAERAIVETDPARPSERAPVGARRALAGDLDTIVLKALRKEPERRYQSVAALADDLGRYLRGLPVSARPDTVRYRVAKFVRRNAAGVVAAAIALVALAGTTAVTFVQSRRVAREAELVTRERDKALEVRSFLMEMFGASGANRAVGDTVTVRRLLDLQAAALASAYPDRPDLRAELMDVLADGYDRLGLYQEAEPLARQALDLRRASLPAGHPDIAASVNMLGWILHEVGRSREAEPVLREAVAIRRAAGPRYRRDLSRSLNDLGVVLNALSRYDSAEVVLAEALAIRRAELGEEHRAVGITANNLAAAYYYQARLDEATAVQALAVRALEAELGPDHQRVVVALSNLATFRRALGDWEGAAAEYRRLLERQTRLQGADHPVTARVAASLAAVLVEQAAGTGDEEALAEADRLSRGAIAALEARLGPVHPQVGIALEGWRAALHGQGRVREALAAAERSVAILRASLGDDNQNTAQALSGLALAHWRMGDGPRGLRLMREAVAAFERTAGDASPETARIRANLCSIMLWEKVEVREARDLCARAVAALEHAPARFRQMEPVYRLWLAQGHVALGEMHEAAALLDGVRDQINRGTGGAQARRLLDSLSGRVTPR